MKRIKWILESGLYRVVTSHLIECASLVIKCFWIYVNIYRITENIIEISDPEFLRIIRDAGIQKYYEDQPPEIQSILSDQ